MRLIVARMMHKFSPPAPPPSSEHSEAVIRIDWVAPGRPYTVRFSFPGDW